MGQAETGWQVVSGEGEPLESLEKLGQLGGESMGPK